jgi:hypothetical protein
MKNLYTKYVGNPALIREGFLPTLINARYIPAPISAGFPKTVF